MLKDAITQSGNLGGFIAALYTNDYELLGKSLQDVMVEPHRKKLIPYFDEVKTAAMQNGALGSGISGAGPSIFALCKGQQSAQKIANTIEKIYANTNISFNLFISKINTKGCEIIS